MKTTPQTYRHKPTVIEAVQVTELNIWDIERWLGRRCIVADGQRNVIDFSTPSGTAFARIGDWIGRDSAGFYPIKAEIFDASYTHVGPPFATNGDPGYIEWAYRDAMDAVYEILPPNSPISTTLGAAIRAGVLMSLYGEPTERTNEPLLGLATTRQLLQEIDARLRDSEVTGARQIAFWCRNGLESGRADILDYRTVDSQ